MFKFLMITSALLVVANAVSNPADVAATILRYENKVDASGSYNYAYETSNGIQAQETGVGSTYAAGSYSYTAPDGQLIELQYTADENGYQPRGAHLPTPPPIPDYILRALEYIESHPFRQTPSVKRKRNIKKSNPLNKLM